MVILLEPRHPAGNQIAAQTAALLMQAHLMAAKRGHACRLTACRAAADNQHPFRLPGLADGVILFASARRINGAGNGRKRCQSAHTALLAGQARTNPLDLTRPDFVGNIRICQQRTAQGNQIGCAVTNRVAGPVGIIQPSGGDDRNLKNAFENFVVGQVQTFLLVHRRMGPIPGIIGADVPVECIVSGFFQNQCRLYAFLDIPALFSEFFAGQAALPPILDEALDAVPQRYRVILAAFRFDGLNNFDSKPQTVSQASAVLIGPLVEEGNGKLVQQVTFMHGMNLYSVEPGFLGNGSGFGKFSYIGMNFFDRQLPASYIRQPAVRNR
ncbi:hypothetical protein D3C73_626170 [compost metagenome]